MIDAEPLKPEGQISDWVNNEVKDFCSNSDTAMPLTTLGHKFKGKFGESFNQYTAMRNVNLYFRKLVPFIQEFCIDLETLPFLGKLDQAAVRPREMPHLKHPATLKQRYLSPLWAAFIKKLDPGQRRIVSTNPPVRFADRPNSYELQPGEVEIEPNYIAGVDLGEEVDTNIIESNIHQWLAENQLAKDQFLIEPVKKQLAVKTQMLSPTPVQLSATRRGHVRNFLSVLPDEMKRRLLIPGDIVEYLLKMD